MSDIINKIEMIGTPSEVQLVLDRYSSCILGYRHKKRYEKFTGKNVTETDNLTGNNFFESCYSCFPDFNLVVPEPNDLEQYDGSVVENVYESPFYRWRFDNWGVYDDVEEYYKMNLHSYVFITESKVPNILRVMSSEFPNVTFVHDYVELYSQRDYTIEIYQDGIVEHNKVLIKDSIEWRQKISVLIPEQRPQNKLWFGSIRFKNF